MTPDRRAIIQAARCDLGTRFKHQGRASGSGLDCSGLCVVAARAAGIEVKDRTDYERVPNADAFVEAVREALDEISPEDAGPGDWLLFWLSERTRGGRYQYPQHMAMITEVAPEPRIIHAHAERRRVVEHSLLGVYRTRRWADLITHAFRYRGLEPAEETLAR